MAANSIGKTPPSRYLFAFFPCHRFTAYSDNTNDLAQALIIWKTTLAWTTAKHYRVTVFPLAGKMDTHRFTKHDGANPYPGSCSASVQVMNRKTFLNKNNIMPEIQ